jgi:hypothetical protein
LNRSMLQQQSRAPSGAHFEEVRTQNGAAS